MQNRQDLRAQSLKIVVLVGRGFVKPPKNSKKFEKRHKKLLAKIPKIRGIWTARTPKMIELGTIFIKNESKSI